MASPTIQRIAQLNDAFRRGDPNVPGQRFVTAGVVHLLKQLDVPTETLIQRVAHFDDFNDANGPHSEHDFGAFEFHGHQLFWKLDAYDQTMLWGLTILRTSAKPVGFLLSCWLTNGEPRPLRTHQNFREESFGENLQVKNCA